MAIKKGNAPKTIPAKLEIVGGGETNTLSLTFHNRKTSEFLEKLKEVGKALQKSGVPTQEYENALQTEMVLYVVKEWDTDYSVSLEGIKEMEDDRSGMALAILQGFHKVRQVALEGN